MLLSVNSLHVVHPSDIHEVRKLLRKLYLTNYVCIRASGDTRCTEYCRENYCKQYY